MLPSGSLNQAAFSAPNTHTCLTVLRYRVLAAPRPRQPCRSLTARRRRVRGALRVVALRLMLPTSQATVNGPAHLRRGNRCADDVRLDVADRCLDIGEPAAPLA